MRNAVNKSQNLSFHKQAERKTQKPTKSSYSRFAGEKQFEADTNKDEYVEKFKMDENLGET